jgi:hypothetical protein
MRPILLAISLAIGLALTSGCLSWFTEPVHRKEGASYPDRFKRMNEAVFSKAKGKSRPLKNAP